MPTRKSILPLLAVAASAAVALPIVGFAAPGSGLPDLRADPPERPILDGYRLRFDGFVTNVGSGPLDVTGNPSVPGAMKQRRSNGDGTWTDVGSPLVKYETADTHNHFHLMNAMRYSLRRADGNALVAPAQKVGFCLYDLDRASGAPVSDPGVYAPDNFCQVGNPTATFLSMGVSAGWRDVYDRNLALQWVDVSNTQPGDYRIAAEADPFNVVVESNENNPMASIPYTLPGHVAQPVGPVEVPSGSRDRAIALKAATYGGSAAGARRFRITGAPAHGTLNVAVGQETTAGQVLYTPAPGYSGPDSFQFSARGSFSPTSPAVATASIQVGGRVVGSLHISGAPASLVAGTSVQLGATLTPDGPVTWSASAGTISSSGLYVAPGAPPLGGLVTIRATSAADPSVLAEVTIEITPTPKPVPARGNTAGGVSGVNGLLVRPAVKRSGRNISVRTTTRVNGRLTVSAIRNGRAVARCKVGAKAGRRAACKLLLPRKLSRKTVRIAVGLKAAGGQRAAIRLLARPRA